MKQKLVLLAGAVLLSTALTSCYTDPFYGGGYTTVGVGTYRPYYASSFGLGYPGYSGYRPGYYSPLGLGVASRSYGYPYRSYGVPSRGYGYSSPYRHRPSSFSPGFGGGRGHHHSSSFGRGNFHRVGGSGGHHHHRR